MRPHSDRHPRLPAPPQSPASPPMGDYLLVPRSAMSQIQSHIATEQARFPTRRLNQALRIIRHLMGDRSPEIV